MNFKSLMRLLSYPPRRIVSVLVNKVRRVLQITRQKIRYYLKASYHNEDYQPGGLSAFLSGINRQYLLEDSEAILAISDLYKNHYFNILGSGWLKVRYGMDCAGLQGHVYDTNKDNLSDDDSIRQRINRANVPESDSIRKNIQPAYVCIDWQRDIKSGYRWSEKTWYTDIKYGHLPGVDVKIPWELARMQHLPYFAWSYILSSNTDYADEFRNQVLDFIANNPPQWGVNWSCTMDVAIRVSNWLMTYDLFFADGHKFDDAFLAIFERSIYEHGCHISSNMEWDPYTRANHYLADIVGLLFVASYLPENKETNTWLLFSVNELISETHKQFNEDGSNFEASTSYHRLSAEMVIYATALTLRLNSNKRLDIKEHFPLLNERYKQFVIKPVEKYSIKGHKEDVPFPQWYFSRIHGMSEFVSCISKQDGNMPQIGDNDSGRFFKFQPVFNKLSVKDAKEKYANLSTYTGLSAEDVYWDELFQNHEHIIAAVSGLIHSEQYGERYENYLDYILINTLLGNNKVDKGSLGLLFSTDKQQIGADNIWQQHLEQARNSVSPQKMELCFSLASTEHDDVRLYGFPEAGLYLFRNAALYLLIKCGKNGQGGNGGHDHNDQLSIEMWMEGKDIFVDPGTCLYTPLPSVRNKYRSVRAHFAPQLENKEPASLDCGLFHLPDVTQSQVLYFGDKGFVGSHSGYGELIYRMVSLTQYEVKITDYTTGSGKLSDIYDLSRYPCRIPYSPSYGQFLN